MNELEIKRETGKQRCLETGYRRYWEKGGSFVKPYNNPMWGMTITEMNQAAQNGWNIAMLKDKQEKD